MDVAPVTGTERGSSERDRNRLKVKTRDLWKRDEIVPSPTPMGDWSEQNSTRHVIDDEAIGLRRTTKRKGIVKFLQA